MKHEYRSIPLHLIDIPTDRLRQVNPDRVETLAKDIEANGLLQPIGVIENADGFRFTLTFGLHRLHSYKALKRDEIDARVTPAAWIKPQEGRLQEIMENLNREGLTMLGRAENLAELKRVHEVLYPETKNGGDRKSAKRKNQNEIFSFRSEAAEKTGLSRRAIEIAVAMIERLGGDIKTRLRGTWLEDHQAGLRTLSEQTSEMQHRVCDLLFSSPPQASNVVEAIVLAEGRRIPSAADKLFASAGEKFARLSPRQRLSFFDQHEDEIRAYAKDKGWL